jgi:uncharacterized membrane protein
MNDKMDEAIRSCFADRCRPSNEIKAELRKKLVAAQRRRETIMGWAVMAFTLIFSAGLIAAIWMLTGSAAVVYICSVNLLLSGVSGALITFVCRMNRSKGGCEDASVCD